MEKRLSQAVMIGLLVVLVFALTASCGKNSPANEATNAGSSASNRPSSDITDGNTASDNSTGNNITEPQQEPDPPAEPPKTTTNNLSHISAVRIIDPSAGWIAGNGWIARTDDGGETWTNQHNATQNIGAKSN